MADLKGEFADTVSFSNLTSSPIIIVDSATYYTKNGINYGMMFKKAIGKKGNFRIVTRMNFSSFTQTKEYNLPTSFIKASHTVKVLSFTLGAEWAFFPRRALINPFAGADFMASFFSGEFEIENGNETTTNTLSTARRLGFQLGGGIDFQLHQSIGAIVGFNYSFANLIGKRYYGPRGNEYSLDDREHTVGSSAKPSRNINYLQLYGGVSLYFGM